MTIEVDYRFPPGVDGAKQAQVIAIGQTAGTWSARFSHRDSQLKQHLAEVTGIKTDEENYQIVTVSFPEINVEGDIASLLTMIFGKYSMAGVGKVVAVRLPPSYGTRPKFGIEGIRAELGVPDRPLVMAIFKPALGLSAQDHADLLRQVAYGGLDLIKDDEIMGDLEVAPTLARWRHCRQVLEEVKAETGKTILYAVNITGRAQELLTKARILVAEGANALLLNVLPYGFGILEAIAADPDINVPIFAHPALAGALCAAPDHGLAYSVVLGTLMGYGGADAVLHPTHYGSLPFPVEEEEKIGQILRERRVFPVPSAGINPGIVPQAIASYGSDLILNAGTSIMDHPDGPASGVQAFFEVLKNYNF